MAQVARSTQSLARRQPLLRLGGVFTLGFGGLFGELTTETGSLFRQEEFRRPTPSQSRGNTRQAQPVRDGRESRARVTRMRSFRRVGLPGSIRLPLALWQELERFAAAELPSASLDDFALLFLASLRVT